MDRFSMRFPILTIVLLWLAECLPIGISRKLRQASSPPCTSYPIPADNSALTNPAYRPPGYYDAVISSQDFPGFLNGYLQQSPSWKVDPNNKCVYLQ